MDRKNNNLNALAKKVNSINKNIKKHAYWKFIALGIFLILISFTAYFVQRQQEIRQTTAVSNPNRINYLDQEWYVHGANVPWYNWACDFGCNTNGGVSGNMDVLRQGFQKLQNAGMNTARWWVFPGDPWQIERDSSGTPTGLNQSVYADFDAALELAEEFDLYYNFVLFSDTVSIPDTWLSDSAQREKLAQVLEPLFARYANNPRVMTWEIFNEPEWQIWNDQTDEQQVRELTRALTQSVHDNSSALVTVGHAMLDGIPMFKDVGLDYYSPHWYDYMESGDWCARCTDYQTIADRYSIERPVVIGEFYAGADDNLERFEDFYNKGYAGAWPWSLFFNRTNDQLEIDLVASSTFSQNKTDLGPNESALTQPTPTTTDTQPTATEAPTNIEPLTELLLDPSSSNIIVNDSFTVEIRINTNGQTINGVDAQISYPSSVLELTSVNTDNSNFDIEIEKTTTDGSIVLAYATSEPLSGNVLVGAINFQAISSGVANVNFLSSSEVVSDVSNDDVINTVTNGTYTVVEPSPTPTPIEGDVNTDGIVDVQDLSYLLSNWKSSDGTADFNGNGTVEIRDLSILLSNWTSGQ